MKVGLCTTGLALCCSWVMLATATGEEQSPPVTAPQQKAGGLTCRTYATHLTFVTSGAGGYISTANLKASYNTSTNQVHSTIVTETTGNCRQTSTSVLRYRSTADFVDETSVVPPRPFFTSQVTKTVGSGTCPATAGVTETYTYDIRRRLTQVSAVGGSTVTTRYTAWDAAGRKTRGISSAPGSVTMTLTYTYNDSTRTETTHTSSSAGSSTSNTVYDVNGNPVRTVVKRGATTLQTTTWTVKSTAKVCR